LKAPSLLRTSFFSTVVRIGLTMPGFRSPAFFQSVMLASPKAKRGPTWLMMAIRTTSGRWTLYESELTTTAGLFLLAD
jgi:hypothetical protein